MTGTDIFMVILVSLGGYLLGSLNSSLVVGRFYGVDVRKHGSGNAGATNTLRTLGKGAALLTTLGDILKGVAACLIGKWVAGEPGLVFAGMGAVLGHNWPLYFGFKGGKGILTSFAVVLMIDWRIALGLLGLFIIIVALTRYISLGSIIGSALLPVVALILKKPYYLVIAWLVLAILAVYRHRANIGRLLQGNENKLGAKKN